MDEITTKVLSGGHWRSSGKTPAATVSARLYSDIKSKGEASPFIKVLPQTFALRSLKDELPRANFTFVDCAHKVLATCGDEKPMHYREITRKALAQGWLITQGKTPEVTMYAAILTESKRSSQQGEQPRFVLHGRGYVGLSQWEPEPSALSGLIAQHNRQVRQALHEHLLAMKPGEFEGIIAQLLAEMGFEQVEVTKLSHDGGIDVRGTLVVGGVVRIKMVVQAKKWKRNKIQAPIVREVRGSLGVHEQGLIITTSDFTTGAVTEAAQPDKTPIALMNGNQLVTQLMEHGIGVRHSTPALFELDHESWLPGEGK